MSLGEAIGNAAGGLVSGVLANGAEKNAQATAEQQRDSALAGVQARTNDYVTALQKWIAANPNPATATPAQAGQIPVLGTASGAGVTSPYAAAVQHVTGGGAGMMPYQSGFASGYRAPTAPPSAPAAARYAM